MTISSFEEVISMIQDLYDRTYQKEAIREHKELVSNVKILKLTFLLGADSFFPYRREHSSE